MNFNTLPWLRLISTFCLLFINVNDSHAQNSDTYYSIIENGKKQYNNYLSNSFNSYFNKSTQLNKLEVPPETDLQNINIDRDLGIINANEPLTRISRNLQFQNNAFQNNVELGWLNSRISNFFSSSYQLSNLTRSRSTLNDAIVNTRIAATPIRTVVMPTSIAGAAPILNHLWSSPIPNINVRIQYVYQGPIFNYALHNALMENERHFETARQFLSLMLLDFGIPGLIFEGGHSMYEIYHGEFLLGSVSGIGAVGKHLITEHLYEMLNKERQQQELIIRQQFK